MAKRGQAVRRSPTRSKVPTKPKGAPADVDLKKENATLRRELTEALERQTATSEVLEVISDRPSELTPVFQSMVESMSVKGQSLPKWGVGATSAFPPIATELAGGPFRAISGSGALLRSLVCPATMGQHTSLTERGQQHLFSRRRLKR